MHVSPKLFSIRLHVTPFLDAYIRRSRLAFCFLLVPPEICIAPFFTKCQVTEHVQGHAGACFCTFQWHPSDEGGVLLSVNSLSISDLRDLTARPAMGNRVFRSRVVCVEVYKASF